MKKQHLHVVYIRPSKYDDEGYVLRFWRGVLPSNTLACLDALTRDVAESGALGPDIEVTVDVFDDTVQRVPIKRLAQLNRRPDTRVLVGFAGVQTNQFARSSDLALRFRAEGVAVMVGGFHVSGILALFGEPSHDLQRLLDAGVTLVKGEAEAPGALEGILRDAVNDRLQPIYDIVDFPDLKNAPVPRAHDKLQGRFLVKDMATIDTSRGCPFKCSFCTIINVQGRKMRFRSAACVLKAIEENHARGIKSYFFTDDNFSRNPVWEKIFDGLIAMRARGIEVVFMMQIDTLAHRIKGFAEKAARAGCYLTFVGMESVNPKNLESVGKAQNDVNDYAKMVETWHANNVQVHVGYIIGLPHDTRESIRQDIEILRNHVKVDFASLFMLTPLPGSKDHWQMVQDGVPIDADLNNYDSGHETFAHPNMAPGEWHAAYSESMRTLFSKENIINVLFRVPRQHQYHMFWISVWYRYCALEDLHPMSTGLFRLKERESRRSTFPRESLLRYAWRRARDSAHGLRRYLGLWIEFEEIWLLTRKPDDPRWRTLAELRVKWTEVQERIEECDLRGRYDEAAQELRVMLTATAERLRHTSRAPGRMSRSARRRLRQRAKEAEAYLRHLDVQSPRWRNIVRAEQYISDRVLAGYEELAIRYVAKRRRVSAYRKELLQRVRSGRIMTIDLGKAAYAVLGELLFACRFGLAVLTHK
ncbi:MAG: radical SAM protein [Nitrospiraceae bacterium]|nr:radical SAM protein [Nitrospiraceae bacterium]